MTKRSPVRPLFALLLVIFCGAMLGDTASEALLLANFDADILPNMYLANSLFLFCISLFLITLVDRMDRGYFFLAVLGAHCLLLLLIRAGASMQLKLIYPILFSYSYVTKILIFMFFWTIANDICDAREAKNIFPKIAAGGVLGGLGISFSVSGIVRVLSPENLILLWVGLSVLCVFLFLPINRTYRKDLRGKPASEKEKLSLAADFRIIKEEPLLKNMALLYFLVFFLLLNQDFQFYGILRETFIKVKGQGADLATSLSSFLGIFRGTSTTITFLIQITIAGWFLQKLGTANSMYLLPIAFTVLFFSLFLQSVTGWMPDGMLVSAVSVFHYSMFTLLIVSVGVRYALFDSIFSPNFQIFFSSLPKEIRGRGKIFIEGVVKPLAISLAGLFMMLVANRIPRSWVFLLLTAVAVLLVLLTARLRNCYTDSIARYLGGLKAQRLSSILNIRSDQAGESLLAVLTRSLQSEEEDLRDFGIEMLCRFNTDESIHFLLEEARKPDSPIRGKIIQALAGLEKPEFQELFKDALVDSNEDVVANAIYGISKLRLADIKDLVRPYMFHANSRIRAYAVAALWPLADEIEKEKSLKVLRRLVSSGNDSDACSAFYAMGSLGDEQFLPFFRDALSTLPNREVQLFQEWSSALGKFDSQEAMDLLFESIRTAKRRDFPQIKRSLMELAQRFEKPFLDRLAHEDWNVRLCALEIVQKTDLRKSREARKRVRAVGLEIASDAHRLLEIIRKQFQGHTEPEVQFLATVLHEEWIERAKECLMAVAGILDPTGKIDLVAKRLRDANAHMRANAIEALENLGDPGVNRLVVPLFERGKTKTSALPPGRVWESEPAGFVPFLGRIMELKQPWIHASCIFACYHLYIKREDRTFLEVVDAAGKGVEGITDRLAEALWQ